jgi:ABC-type Fe3+ transport system permease subunit
MEGIQAIAAYVLAALLLVVSIYISVQQFRSLRKLRGQTYLSDEDRSYVRYQSWVRLTGCILMVILGAMVAGGYVMGLNEQANELGKAAEEQKLHGEQPQMTPEQRRVGQLFGAYWIAVLVLLMVIVLLAALDMWAIRRYGRRQLEQLEADYRAGVEKDVALLRSRRNGHQ